jgi:hypothetical protein
MLNILNDLSIFSSTAFEVYKCSSCGNLLKRCGNTTSGYSDGKFITPLINSINKQKNIVMTEDYQTQLDDLSNPYDNYTSSFSNEELTDWATDAWSTFGMELDSSHILIDNDYATSIGVLTYDPSTLSDDYLEIGKKQLAELNITDKDSVRFILEHEATHTALQNATIFEDNWHEELACDFMAGVASELKGFDINNAINNFEHIKADADHPTAELRGDFAQYGKTVAQEFKNDGTDFTLKNLMEKFFEHSNAEAQTIDEAHSNIISSLEKEINPDSDKKKYGKPCDDVCAAIISTWTDRKDFGRG